MGRQDPGRPTPCFAHIQVSVEQQESGAPCPAASTNITKCSSSNLASTRGTEEMRWQSHCQANYHVTLWKKGKCYFRAEIRKFTKFVL